MPSIIGNSTITSTNDGLTGPQGPQGPVGATGFPSFGNTGATGPTGAYIISTSFNSFTNKIGFSLSDGIVLLATGITGATSYYSNVYGVTGVSSVFNSLNPNKIFSLFKGVVGGKTLEFRGVTGAGTITASLDGTGNIVYLTINPTATSTVYGSTLANFLLYTTETSTATTTRIGITGSKNTLSIGLTADDGATGSTVKVYSDFIDNIYNINSLSRINPVAATDDVVTGFGENGLVVNLNKYSTYKLQTPIGISAFNVTSDSSEIRSYTFFIDGSDVWNFPSNVYFENTEKGLGNYGFLSGTNIVHMWTTNGGLSFNANIIDRGMGYAGPFYSDSIGSCCYNSGTSCIEYVSPEVCNQVYRGTFTPSKICSDSCGVFKSCCLDGSCYNNVEESICIAFGGVPKTQTCTGTLCQTDPDGACCLGFGRCQNTKASGCAALGGHFTPNKNCNQIQNICGTDEIGICGNPDDCTWLSSGAPGAGAGDPKLINTTRRDCDQLIQNQINCRLSPETCRRSEWILDYKFYPHTILPGVQDNVWPQPNLTTVGLDGQVYQQTNNQGCFNGHCCAVVADFDCSLSGGSRGFKYTCSDKVLESRTACRNRSVYPWFEYWKWTKVLGQNCADLQCVNAFREGNANKPCTCGDSIPGKPDVCFGTNTPPNLRQCYSTTIGRCISDGNVPYDPGVSCVPYTSENGNVCHYLPDRPGLPIALGIIPDKNCTSGCLECNNTCLGVCCFGPNNAAINTDCATCTTLNGIFFGGFNTQQGINPCSAIAEGALGKCCTSGRCTQTSYADCTGQWFINQDCTTPCVDTSQYFLSSIDDPTTRNVLNEIILTKAPKPGTSSFIYKADFYLYFTTNSTSTSSIILPNTLTVSSLPSGSPNIIVQRTTGDNATQYADQAVIPVSVFFDPWVDPNVNSTYQNLGPVYLPVQVKNSNGTVVLENFIQIYFNGRTETATGCKACSVDSNTKYKLQIRANMQRFCTDCQKYNPVTSECSPSVLKEQQVIANVCLARSPDCGWGITLDSAVYSNIENVWDCTYGVNDQNMCRVDATAEAAFGCPDIQSFPYSEFNPRPIPAPGLVCGPTVMYNYAAELSNYWVGPCNTVATNASTNSTTSYKGETKIAVSDGNCPGGRAFIPYYNTIEFTPETYSKFKKYGISEINTKTLLDSLGEKLLTLQNNDGQPNPKLAFNPDRQNQAVSLRPDIDITPCSGNLLFNNSNGNEIFNYTPAANEIVKYYLLLSKKTNTFKTEVEYLKNVENAIVPFGGASGITGADGCVSAFNWGVVRIVVDNSNAKTIKLDKCCSTKILNGDSDFGKTTVSISLNRKENISDFNFITKIKLNQKEILSGIPCFSSSVYLVGEINPDRINGDLDYSDPAYPKGKLQFANNEYYSPTPSNVLFDYTDIFDSTANNYVYKTETVYTNTCVEPSKNTSSIIYDPYILGNVRNTNINVNNSVFAKLPVHTPFLNLGDRGYFAGESIADKIDAYFLNTVECQPNTIKCGGNQNSCLKSYDQYSYKNCFKCSNTNNTNKYNYSDILQESTKNWNNVDANFVMKLDVRQITNANLQYNLLFGYVPRDQNVYYLEPESVVPGDNIIVTPIYYELYHLDLGLNRNIKGSDGVFYNTNEINGKNTDGSYGPLTRLAGSNITFKVDPTNEDAFCCNTIDPITNTPDYDGFYKVPFSFNPMDPNGGNQWDQYFAVESCVYMTGYDVSEIIGFDALAFYGDVPVISGNYIHDPNKTHSSNVTGFLAPTTSILAIHSNPHVNATVFTNGSPSTITVYPNITVNTYKDIPVLVDVQSMKLEGWLVKDIHQGNANTDRIDPFIAPVKLKVIDNTYNSTQNVVQFSIPSIDSQWAPRVNGENIVKMVFKMKVVVNITDLNGVQLLNGDVTPMTRSITRIFSVKTKPVITFTGDMNPRQDFPVDVPLFANKNMNGVCVNIDCTNNVLLCDSLEDC